MDLQLEVLEEMRDNLSWTIENGRVDKFVCHFT